MTTAFSLLPAGIVVALHGRMSVARPVYKNVTVMLTRRCRGRRFLLRPDDDTNQVIGYVLAVMLKKWNIKLTATTALGNHWHPLVTDTDGTIVEFKHDCHQFIARALNARYGDEENLWNTSQTSRVECVQPEDIIGLMANPVEAGLVRYGHSWPGLRYAWPHKPIVFRRPRWFFRGEEDGGSWPEEAVLELSRPPGFDDMSDDQLAEVIKSAVFEREEGIRREFDAAGRRFLGRRAVLRQSRHAAATSPEKRFGVSPTIACKDKQRRIERLRQNQQWRDRYANVLRRWRAGERDVVFPYGTYRMRVVHRVSCAPPPT